MADPHPAEVTWRKSSRSMSGENNCVEIAAVDGEIWMRDSKNPDNGIVRFTPESWTSFIDTVKADLLPQSRSDSDSAGDQDRAQSI